MTTKQRFRNGKYRLELREKDHSPMHVHLVGGSIDIMIDLHSLKTLEGSWPKGLQPEVMTWIKIHQDDLIAEWKQWHP